MFEQMGEANHLSIIDPVAGLSAQKLYVAIFLMNEEKHRSAA